MAWVVAAIGGSALAAAIGGGSALLGAGASIYGSNKQADAANNAANLQKSMFDSSVARSKPFVDFGAGQLGTLNNLLTPGQSQTDTLSKLPGFQFSQDWGQKAIKNQGTMNGLSGNTLRAGADYATGSAQQYFGNYVNQLLSAAGIGSGAAGALANQSVSAGGNIAGSMTNAGTAQANGIAGASGAITGGLNNYTNYANMNNMLQQITNGGMYGQSSVGGNPLTYGGLKTAGY